MNAILVALHLASIAGLALYGLLGFLTRWLFIRHRRGDLSLAPVAVDELPSVTVQLPIYNEREVVRRLIDAAVALDYPQDRLEIQVLDDSSDDTTGLAAECVAYYCSQGADISLIHRHHRRGFKAGALAEALPAARGEFIAIFDADFVPTPDFLLRAMPYFLADSGLGAVQARWGHLNAANSGLTGAQAVALDKHFSIEQVVRHRADYFPKFNGSAGIWRRDCILDSGGWQDDTVCEDLCLSTRAVLGGWRFHFAHDLVAPAELPATILAYKTQQARWAMGATQCLTKYARSIWRAGQYPVIARLYALLSMAAYSTHALLLLLLLVQLPLLLMGQRLPSWFMLFSLLGLGQPILFVLAQQMLYRDWRKRLRHFPTLLLVAIGIAPSNTWAVLRALFARDFTFARTPKGPQRSYRLTTGRMLAAELILAVYSAVTLSLAVMTGNTAPVFLLTASLLGFGYVAFLGIVENHASN